MEKRRVSSEFCALFLIAAVASMQIACTKKDEMGTVRVVLPANFSAASSKAGSTSHASAQSVSASSVSGDTWNSGINPIAANELNCFAVFVGAADLSDSYCSIGLTSADATTIRFGPNIGFKKPGEAIELTVTPGKRTIYVVGTKATDLASCTAGYSEGVRSNLSEPFLIATQPVSIVSGTNPPVNISAALDTTKKVLDCKIAGLSGSGGAGGNPFGDKRDGSISATSGIITAGTSTLISNTTRSGTSPLLDSKIVGASRRIVGIATSGTDAGRAVTLGSSFAATEFEAGDEVAWFVVGGARTGYSVDDPVNGACGGSFYTGRFGFLRIKTVVNGTDLILDQPISGSPLTIKTANLAAPPTSTDYCTIVLTRVSSFDTISVPASSSLQINAAPFNYTSGTGGILVVRAETISVNAASTLTFGASAGYGGGATSLYQGQGLNSYGTQATNTNYNGGAPGTSSAIGGGGGGHAGAGASGVGLSGTSGLGGAPLNHCPTGACKPFDDQKTFMGGGGGAAGSSASGGAGGGIVLVYSRNITGAGAVWIKADGNNGGTSSAGAGGGAGGTAGLFVQNRTVDSLNISANGGNGGSATATGGGGGGGVVNLYRCSTNFTGTTFNALTAGGTGGSGAASGVSSINDSATCSIP